ncbi:AraC family transcriptional regulator [Bdellovibrio svalbardensis]|uniref:AraC family transcriptional regulator n=1 Tax=Bdellovibrio svalbardensis TaxID=2972972 RepID=A0ABT6DLC7_9BACT|nr:AraC family transcriptional regulator [Bdellovibrio svalbardensis]MDG0817618.1 AraC family transcriptional regulator [Bdellovibrio svalbardensis]
MSSGANKLKKMHPIESLGIAPASRGDIRIERLEDRLTPKVPFPHKHNFFQIVVIMSSSGRHEIDFKSYPVKTRQVFVIKPGQVHAWQLSTKTKGFIIEYTEDSFSAKKVSNSSLRKDNPAKRSRLLPDHFKFAVSDSPLSLNFLELMESEYIQKNENYEACLQNYLEIFLIHLLRVTQSEVHRHSKQEDLVAKFMDLVEAHFHEEHHVQFYADHLQLSAKSLSVRIQKILGKPAKEIILQRCLLEAKRLLANSQLSVADIGYELGFDDPNYFSRFLKQNMTVSAMQFRKQKRTAPRNKN